MMSLRIDLVKPLNMAENTTSAALVGCTGLVVSTPPLYLFLAGLNSHTSIGVAQSHSFAVPFIASHSTRNRSKECPTTSSNLQPVIQPDSSTWPKSIPSLSPTPDILFSALGTTKAAAGSIEAQRTIDYDLNLAIARAAK